MKYRHENSKVFLSSSLPMADIDVPDAAHVSQECVTVASRHAAEMLLRAMARALRCACIIRRTAGGVHAYFLRPLELEEWAEVHSRFGGDPLYTRLTLSRREGWWDRVSPKPGRAVDDNPADWYVYNPVGAAPDRGLVEAWRLNNGARWAAAAGGADNAKAFLQACGVPEYVRPPMPPPPSPRQLGRI